MKNQLIFTALTLGAIILGTNTIKAQTSTAEPVSSETKVNIELSDVLSIHTPATEVTFTYKTASDYNTTQKHTVVGNLNVTSSSKFDVGVRAFGDNFTNAEGIDIPVEVLSIKPAPTSGTTTMTGARANVLKLSTTDQTIITNADLGSEVLLDVEYEILDSQSKENILGKSTKTPYTQQVIYTATAQ